MYKIRNIFSRKQEVKLFNRCFNTPLSVFIDCSVNSNYERLIIAGKPDRKTLQNTWQTLWYEYCDLKGSPEYTSLITLIKDLAYNKGRLTAIRLAVEVLRHMPDESCVNLLKKHGYRFTFDRSNIVEFNSTLDRILSNSNALEIVIKQDEKRIEDLNKESDKKGVVTTAELWADNLAKLSKYMHYRIDPEITPVTEYIRITKMYDAEIESIKKLSNKS